MLPACCGLTKTPHAFTARTRSHAGGVRATAQMRTVRTPAPSSVRATSAAVAPVVSTSSTMATSAPAETRPAAEGVPEAASPGCRVEGLLRRGVADPGDAAVVDRQAARAREACRQERGLVVAPGHPPPPGEGYRDHDVRWRRRAERVEGQVRQHARLEESVAAFQPVDQPREGRPVQERGDGRCVGRRGELAGGTGPAGDRRRPRAARAGVDVAREVGLAGRAEIEGPAGPAAAQDADARHEAPEEVRHRPPSVDVAAGRSQGTRGRREGAVGKSPGSVHAFDDVVEEGAGSVVRESCQEGLGAVGEVRPGFQPARVSAVR